MSTSITTHDHKKIKQWAVERGGIPTTIRELAKKDGESVLRIHFPKQSKNDGDFEQLSCDDFFNNIDEKNLDLVYKDEKAAGETSTFHKFVERGYEDGK
jgi:hypothetical protein